MSGPPFRPLRPDLFDSAQFAYSNERGVYSSGGGGGGAPSDATYVVLGVNGTLTNERVLTAGAGITLTDAGAGSTITIASSGGGNSATVDITPTSGDSFTSATVTAAWAGVSSRIVATVVDHPSGASAEEAAAEGIVVTCGNISAGVGFDTYLHSPDGATGPYRVSFVGV